jgi:hypothetical protein
MKTIILLSLLSIIGLSFVGPFTSNNEYFELANQKIQKYNPPRKDYVIIIDYRKNLLSKRLFVLDMKSNKVVVESRVTHALNSGKLYATDFSNTPNSKKSCVGALLTQNPRMGRYGYSMVVRGLDQGINDNIKKRVIIFHPTRAPWSEGCFAASRETIKKVIDLTHDGCLVYVIK